MKHYWLLIQYTQKSGRIYSQQEVSADHPFTRLRYWRDWCEKHSAPFDDIELINWKEITEEEYNLFKTLIDENT